MAQKQQTSSSGSKRSSGGGRTPNSEPKYQIFEAFGGCNFELSPRDFDLTGDASEDEQSDLKMNFVVIQDNVGLATNKTMQTRPATESLFTAPAGASFTDASILIGSELFIATDDGEVWYGDVGSGELTGKLELDDRTGTEHHWESFAYVDGKLVGATAENQLWSGPVSEHRLANAKRVPEPAAPAISNIEAAGSLKVSASYSDECCFRIAVAWTYVNKYGPTAASEQFAFYANTAVAEWHSGCYAVLKGSAPVGYGIEAVEVYYTVDNSSSMIFAGRTDFAGQDGGAWRFAWYGYVDATTMWPVANLTMPTENVTEGAPVSRMKVIDGRVYMWGDSEMPYRLYIGGNSGNLLSVSNGTGGGYVDVEPDTGLSIRFVDKYKTQSGNSIVTMMCDSPNSTREMRFNLVENTVSLSNEQSMKSWQAEQVAGAVGCKSPHGADVCEDGLYSVSRYGLALTTLTMEYNSQIRTNYVSDPVKPAFADALGKRLGNAVLLDADGVLYLCMGDGAGNLENVLFCYDVALKAWWTYSMQGLEGPVLDLVHIDWEGHREGIGVVTAKQVRLLPTTQDGRTDSIPETPVLIETGELSTQQPMQSWSYVSQLEFRFDWFVGELVVELEGIDIFGRPVTVRKLIGWAEPQRNLREFMRVDLKLESYKLTFRGKAGFRMTHFIAKVFQKSKKIGLVRGFDVSQTHISDGDIHPTFKDYDDIRNALIP